MSIQTETVPNGGPSGPELSGLQTMSSGSAVVVNQSPDEATAQHHHNSHDPYTSTYPAYANLPVPYNPAYNTEVNIPTYYTHDTSQSSHSTPGQTSGHDPSSRHDQDTRPHASNHHESSQSRTGLQQTTQDLSQSEPGTDPRASLPYQPAPQDQAPSQSFAESSMGGSKRGYEGTNGPGDEAKLSRRQRQRMSVADTDMESMRDDSDIGPSGGPKHWTDDEKARLFHWLLENDERWEAFGTKMNTVFREGSTQLYNSRKSFTALKSCYHRNLEIFKQMYVFEAFLARAPIAPPVQSETVEPIASASTNDASAVILDPEEVENTPNPVTFSSATDRQMFLERKLEAAKTLNIPISNLSVKTIDHWFDMGWFALFKRRFQEDPKTGLPTPRYAADREGEDDAEGEEVPEDPEHGATDPALQGARTVAEARRRHLDPLSSLIPPPLPNPMAVSRSALSSQRSHRAETPPAPPLVALAATQPQPQHSQSSSHYSHSPQASPQMPYVYPHPPIPFFPPPTAAADYQAQQQQQQQQLHFQMQTAQSLTQLTNMTQTLLGTCNTLVEVLKVQSEEIKAQTELLRRQEGRAESVDQPAASAGLSEQGAARSDGAGATNKAAAATEVLANPRVADDVKRAAADYLKRLFQ